MRGTWGWTLVSTANDLKANPSGIYIFSHAKYNGDNPIIVDIRSANHFTKVKKDGKFSDIWHAWFDVTRQLFICMLLRLKMAMVLFLQRR